MTEVTTTNDIQENIAKDRNLDRRAFCSLSEEAAVALRKMADDEFGGNRSGAVRSCIMAALKQRYLLGEEAEA